MLLTVDISNSHITLGGYQKKDGHLQDNLSFMARLVTETKRTDDQYAVELQQILRLYHINPQQVEDVIIASVVPDLNTTFCQAVKKTTGIFPLFVGPGVKTGLNIRIDNPAQLGADLVAGAVAAIAKYPLPAILFDFGTATTVSVLDPQGRFVGGVICPGVALTLNALASQTALLPHISIEKPSTVIGANTIHSMQSGAVYGVAAMIDGLAQRIEGELGCPATLVATGNLSEIVVSACSRTIHICEHLLLEGLKLIYLKNKKDRIPPTQ